MLRFNKEEGRFFELPWLCFLRQNSWVVVVVVRLGVWSHFCPVSNPWEKVPDTNLHPHKQTLFHHSPKIIHLRPIHTFKGFFVIIWGVILWYDDQDTPRLTIIKRIPGIMLKKNPKSIKITPYIGHYLEVCV
jgi:hypothetical protein